MMAQHMLAHCNIGIFIKIRVISIMQKKNRTYLYENLVIFFYKNNFSTYMLTSSDVDNSYMYLEFESVLRQAYDVETGIERTLIVTYVMSCLY